MAIDPPLDALNGAKRSAALPVSTAKSTAGEELLTVTDRLNRHTHLNTRGIAWAVAKGRAARDYCGRSSFGIVRDRVPAALKARAKRTIVAVDPAVVTNICPTLGREQGECGQCY